MKIKWDLHVNDFGKIKDAAVGINHMMIFVGDNGSGKSYIMTLLWGLINRSTFLIDGFDISKLKYYNKCSYWLKSLENFIGKGILQVDMQKNFVNLFNEILEIRKDLFLHNIFNGDIYIGKLKIENFQSGDIKYDCDDSGITFENSPVGYILSGIDGNDDYDTLIKGQVFNICKHILFSELKSEDLFSGDVLYFPAARTGFTLAYKTLLAGAVESAFSSTVNEKNIKSVFSEPVINFLRRWTLLNRSTNKSKPKISGKKSSSKDNEIIEYLEMILLKGKIKKNDMPLPDIFFIPDGSKEEIPIHMASSLITELTPLVLFLSQNSYKTIIIEEPEAHLHLKIQILMAKLLAKLLNKGTNIWISTHSDTLVQEINTLIKFNKSDNKKHYLEKYNIQKDECIDFNKVGVYEFVDTGSFVAVSEASGDEEGFEYQQFSDAILSQTNISIDLGSKNDGDKV